MKTKKFIKTCLFVCITALVAGCGSAPAAAPTLDPIAVMTDVAGTIQADLTQTALLAPTATIAPPPTATPLPIPTQPIGATPTIPANASAPVFVLPPDSPDAALFIEDVTYPDGSILQPGERFTKTWKVENTGTTTWNTGYFYRYLDGKPIMCNEDDMFIFITNPVKPNNQVTLSVRMTAPNTLGSYENYFIMANDKGQIFGDTLYVKIVVDSVDE
ncbi:MAG: hypothetical protein J7K66_03070 [Anaerolineaceae bacterium]|nr:hypothetical protein [Anaerolineaceae bacterium]